MKRNGIHRLGDLQLSIMQVLWNRGASSVSQVHRALGEPLAYTTVATMLRKMEQRGLLRHREVGRRFIYEARVSADRVSRSMADRLIDRLYQGSLTRAVSHLLETRDVDAAELEDLERMIRKRRERSR
jgi:predicted transcriptional regulator